MRARTYRRSPPQREVDPALVELNPRIAAVRTDVAQDQLGERLGERATRGNDVLETEDLQPGRLPHEPTPPVSRTARPTAPCLLLATGALFADVELQAQPIAARIRVQ